MNYRLIDLQYDIEYLRKSLLKEKDNDKRRMIQFSISLLYRIIESNFNVNAGRKESFQETYKDEYDAIDEVMFDYRDNKQMLASTFDSFTKIKIFKPDNMSLYREFSQNEMHEILSMFFSVLGNDFYLMYKKIFNNAYISDSVYSSSFVDGCCMFVPSLKHSYISINASRCFMIYLYTIIHEIGHYYESLSLDCSNIKDFYKIINSPFSEVSSTFFTNIFLSFLLENNIHKREALTSFSIDNNNIIDFVREANFCFRYMNECSSYTLSNNINFIDIEYFNQLNREMSLKEGIFDNYDRNNIDMLDSTKYSFSNVVADHLWRLYMNDRKLAFDKLGIISDNYKMPMLEVLKLAKIKVNDLETCKGSKVKGLYINKNFMS